MWLSDVSVKRPVMAIVLSLLLCVFGAVSFSTLSVREMPDIDSPVVSIYTGYSGASASIMESQVTQLIEDELSGISGIEEITSVSRNGSSRITVEFKLDHPLTEGVSDVRDAVARAQGGLPDDANDPIVYKDNGTGEAAVYINLASSEMDRNQLTEYAQRTLEDRFSLISGVSSVDLYGALYKVMYVKLNPTQMAGHGVTTQDILDALRDENLESPGGEIRNDVMTMPVRSDRLYRDAEDFKQLVVRTTANGTAIYLSDVAEVAIGSRNEDATYKNNGINNLSLALIPQSDANPLDISARAHKLVDEMQAFLPEGTRLWVDYDTTVFIDRSIEEVYSTLFITGALVVLVLYIFIGQARATLIPAVTVPVSLISAFIVASAMGFSINLLTLMALILAIGLVVDDAIVVVENIFHHLQQGDPPLVAAYRGAREVGFAVIATTAVLVMVFLPITYMDGMIGKLFTEFAVMLAVTVLCSSLIALTLTPVLGSKLLRLNVTSSPVNRVITRGFDVLESYYRRVLAHVLRWRWMAPVVILLCIGGSGVLMQHLPSQLVPQEDRGVLLAFVRGAEGTAYNRMVGNIEQIEQRLMPLVEAGTLSSVSVQTPAFGGRAGDQTGFVIMLLPDWDERDRSAQDILAEVRQVLNGVPDVQVFPFAPGFGGGSSEPVQFVLSGPDYPELHRWAEKLGEMGREAGMIDSPDYDYNQTTPELVVKVDRRRASELGISVRDVSDTLEVMLGGRAQTSYVDRGEEYDVYVRGDEKAFSSKGDLSRIYMRSRSGKLVSLDAVTTVEETASAQRLNHTNKQKSITLSAHLGEGVTLGQALDYLDRVAAENLPADISVGYSGESKDFRENQTSVLVVFGLALLVSYLVLAAQFESFINPLVVMLTVPMGMLGGFLGLWLTNQGINIYSQIGLIMLIGMVTKNGILIVEFANQLRDRGIAFEKAIIDASVRRLRPILMTAFTTLAGMIPLILSTGAGAESRIAVGTVIFTGMAFATFVTLLVIPAMYRLLSIHTHSPEYVAQQLDKALAVETVHRASHGEFDTHPHDEPHK
ncbi:multidrug efflux RND transporter permease subunit [Salinivibrio sp. SS2]|uniref:multidrug efflux RND transporter permease subunit n=1 Tax=Salinivibrio sp. SS2 TaxID=1892894 RepID=UPI00084C3454|nr:multidrug efflux RND transporter permease subunit [Salinivibrio sp. DV]ODQ00455.1 multidrug transporter AcrB [Salinivibrio sp. DV]